MTDSSSRDSRTHLVFTPTQKRRIAGEAKTLDERFSEGHFAEGVNDADEVREILEEWEGHYTTEEAFERRRERLGVTRADCRRAIAAGAIPPADPLPAWVERLDGLAAAIRNADPEDATTAVDSSDDDSERSHPFGPLTAAIAVHARERLSEELVGEQLDESAVEGTMATLRRRFESQFTRLLYAEFKSSVAANDPELAAASPDDFEELPTEYYEQFVEFLFEGGFEQLCLEYPMFGRLVTTLLRQWRERVAEFCRRLRCDRDAIRDRFETGGRLGRVTELSPLTNDTHGDGRAVMRVTFESGFELVYKPRSVESGTAFYRTLDDLNEFSSVPDFETPTYLAGDDYGWMELLEHRDCSSESQIVRYYRRAGALCCLAYLFEFTDCHFENLVATGEQPLLVDVETVFHPYVSAERRPYSWRAGQVLEDNVVLSSLLPYRVRYHDNERTSRMTEISAGISVSSDPVEVSTSTSSELRGVNSDAMTYERVRSPYERSNNHPKIDGEAMPPDDYLDDIVAGFETTYETIVALRDEGRLADELGLFERFESVVNRIAYRTTMSYSRLLGSITSRDCLADGARFGVELERLAVPFYDGQVVDPPWTLYEAEREDLKHLDRPRFTCRPDATEFHHDGVPIGETVDVSGIDRAKARIEAASREQLADQREILRACFGRLPERPPSFEATPTTESEVCDDSLRAEAMALYERVKTAGADLTEGSYSWGSFTSMDATDRLTARPFDTTLHGGRCGVALLGAALYRTTGEEQYRRFALDAIAPVCERISDQLSETASHGGTRGVGSLVYGLATVGDLADEPSLVTAATRATTTVTTEFLESADDDALAGGTAGTLTGLLGLYDRTEESEVLARAIDCGDSLLAAANRVDESSVWNTTTDTRQSAYFRGSDGIVYALARLWDATGDDRYRDAVMDARDGRWATSQTNALALLGLAEYTADETVLDALPDAIDDAATCSPSPFDDLRRGNSGEVELLLTAEHRHGLSAGSARELAGEILERRRRTGRFWLPSEVGRTIDPTYLDGASGLSYTFLRTVSPEVLPCVLLYE